MIRFKCPHCGKAIGVKDDGAGKKGKCPGCGQTVQVPKARVQEKPEPAQTSNPPVRSPAEPKQEIIDVPRTQPPQLPTQRQPPFTTGYQPQPVAPMPAPFAVQVNVNQSRAAHSLGIASLVLGILSFFVCWIPFVGFGFGGLGLVLGIAGLVFSIIRKGSGIGYSIAGIAVSSVAVLIGIGFLVVVSGMFSAIDERARSSGRTPVSNVSGRDDTAEEEWVDANKHGVQRGDVYVGVASASIGRVPLKNMFGDVEQSVDALLQIRLRVENRGQTKKIEYRGWAGDRYGFLSGGAAMLTDNLANTYKRINFANSEIVGQVQSESIYPQKGIDDVLVFEVPVDAIEHLRLELPAEAFGGDGYLRFLIPRGMVTGL